MEYPQRTVILVIVVFTLSACGYTGVSTTTAPTDPLTKAANPSAAYLGQPTPGSSPETFAGGIISGELHTSPVFTPDGSQVFWGQQGGTIMTATLQNGLWTRPESLSLSPAMSDLRDPFLSPSGERLFFLSKGKLPGSNLPVKENIWTVDRLGAGWGEPQPVSELVNAYSLHWQISVDDAGDLYFGAQAPGCGDIYVARFLEDSYQEPEKLGAAINTESLCEQTPFIAPDGSYLIFSRFDLNDSSGMNFLYISYAGQDGSWSEPVKVPRVFYGLCPIVSPDGKFLFFLSSPQNVSWMNTDFIEELKQ